MFKKSTQRTQVKSNIQMPLIFNITTKNTVYTPGKQTVVKKVINQQKVVNNDDSDVTMPWGKPIWYFLHCLAANIDETFFINNRMETLKIFYMICINLPCHICSEHAKQYLDSINFNNLKTKESLVKCFYLFHNEVNRRKKFSLFTENNLHKYNNVHMQKVTNDFLNAYNTSIKLNIYSMSRNQAYKTIRQWINKNYNHFM